jgi:subtilase family serine protease
VLDSQRLYPATASERELDIEGLRAIQYIIDMGLRDLNDWTDIKAIDQFQTAAIRYQLYEHIYALGAYQGITIVAIQPH